MIFVFLRISAVPFVFPAVDKRRLCETAFAMTALESNEVVFLNEMLVLRDTR